MLLLDLDEQPEVFGLSALWSGRWWSPMRFVENDYLRTERQPEENLKACAQRLVREQLGLTLDGPVRLLTQIRSFGMLFNPVSFFYCHDRSGQLRAIICEVTNTPWGERFSYLLETDPEQPRQHFSLAKRFHVSPFLPCDAEYQMHFRRPATVRRQHGPAAPAAQPGATAPRDSSLPLHGAAYRQRHLLAGPASAAQRHTVV